MGAQQYGSGMTAALQPPMGHFPSVAQPVTANAAPGLQSFANPSPGGLNPLFQFAGNQRNDGFRRGQIFGVSCRPATDSDVDLSVRSLVKVPSG